MAGEPTAERPPKGLTDAYWLGVWRHALKVMKAQGTWAWELRPLLDEYVWALLAADVAREENEETAWDRHAKRAAKLADILILTPEARKRHGVYDGSEEEVDPFDEIAEARRRLRAV